MSAALPLFIHKLQPDPLRDRIATLSSGIWQQEIVWDQNDERIFIQAPSGTGKTTLVHILYGLRNDYDGSASWGSTSIRENDAEGLSLLRRESVSVIFQDMRLFPTLTAWENLEIKRGLTNTVTAGEAKSWMDALGIADRADRQAFTLSYGEQQRVSIIRALLQPFKWILMDEPFSHLDQANRALAVGLVAEVVSRNKASLILADLDPNDYFVYTKKCSL